MKTTNNKKDLVKTTLTAFALIGVSTLLFGGLTETAMAAELSGSRTVATTYSAIPAAGAAGQSEVPKASYTVVPDPLTAGQKPSGLALTMDEAAAQGAGLLQTLFDAKLDDATIYLSYSPGTETFPRAFWSGDVRFGERTPANPGYGFMIDAVTGEPFSAVYGRILDVEVPLGPDWELAKNPQQYFDLAVKLVKEKGLVGGAVQSTSYNGQGYGANDPQITINVLGVNGEKLMLSFSRYDQSFLGIGFDKNIRISDAAHEKFMKEMEERGMRADASEDASTPQLKAIPLD